MLGTFHFFSFRVRVQTLGSSYSRAESRVLHFDPRAPAGGASVRLLRKSSVVASLPLQEIQAVAFDEAEPRSLILVARQRQLVDFEDAEDNLVFRLAIASVAVGAFDGAAFASGVIMEGEVAKRGLSGWKTRYALLVPRRLILLSSRTAAYPRTVVPLTRCTPRLDSSVGVLHLEGEAGEVLLRVGNTRSRALAWLAAANRAAATSPLVNPPPPGSNPNSLPASLQSSRRSSLQHITTNTAPFPSPSQHPAPLMPLPPMPPPPTPGTPTHSLRIPSLVPAPEAGPGWGPDRNTSFRSTPTHSRTPAVAAPCGASPSTQPYIAPNTPASQHAAPYQTVPQQQVGSSWRAGPTCPELSRQQPGVSQQAGSYAPGSQHGTTRPHTPTRTQQPPAAAPTGPSTSGWTVVQAIPLSPNARSAPYGPSEAAPTRSPAGGPQRPSWPAPQQETALAQGEPSCVWQPPTLGGWAQPREGEEGCHACHQQGFSRGVHASPAQHEAGGQSSPAAAGDGPVSSSYGAPDVHQQSQQQAHDEAAGLVELAGARAVLADLQAQLRALLASALPPAADECCTSSGAEAVAAGGHTSGWDGTEGTSGGGARSVEVCPCVAPSDARAASWEVWAGPVPAPADPVLVHAHNLGVLRLVLGALRQPMCDPPLGSTLLPGRPREGVPDLAPAAGSTGGTYGTSGTGATDGDGRSSDGMGATLSGAQLVAHVGAVCARWLALYECEEAAGAGPASQVPRGSSRLPAAALAQPPTGYTHQQGHSIGTHGIIGRQGSAQHNGTTTAPAAPTDAAAPAVTLSHFSLSSLLGPAQAGHTPAPSLTPSLGGSSMASAGGNMVEIRPDISHLLPGLSLTLRVRKPGGGGGGGTFSVASSTPSVTAPSLTAPSVTKGAGSVRRVSGSVIPAGLGAAAPSGIPLPSTLPPPPPAYRAPSASVAARMHPGAVAAGIAPGTPIPSRSNPSFVGARGMGSVNEAAGGTDVRTHLNPLYEEAEYDGSPAHQPPTCHQSQLFSADATAEIHGPVAQRTGWQGVTGAVGGTGSTGKGPAGSWSAAGDDVPGLGPHACASIMQAAAQARESAASAVSDAIAALASRGGSSVARDGSSMMGLHGSSGMDQGSGSCSGGRRLHVLPSSLVPAAADGPSSIADHDTSNSPNRNPSLSPSITASQMHQSQRQPAASAGSQAMASWLSLDTLPTPATAATATPTAASAATAVPGTRISSIIQATSTPPQDFGRSISMHSSSKAQGAGSVPLPGLGQGQGKEAAGSSMAPNGEAHELGESRAPSYASVARTTQSLQSLLRQLNGGGLSPAGFLRELSSVGGEGGRQ